MRYDRSPFLTLSFSLPIFPLFAFKVLRDAFHASLYWSRRRMEFPRQHMAFEEILGQWHPWWSAARNRGITLPRQSVLARANGTINARDKESVLQLECIVAEKLRADLFIVVLRSSIVTLFGCKSERDILVHCATVRSKLARSTESASPRKWSNYSGERGDVIIIFKFIQ